MLNMDDFVSEIYEKMSAYDTMDPELEDLELLRLKMDDIPHQVDSEYNGSAFNASISGMEYRSLFQGAHAE